MSAKCPRCFVVLPSDYALYVCKGECQPQSDAVATAYAGTAVANPPGTEIHGVLPPIGKWPQCRGGNHLAGQELCPRCHQLLPPRWREYDTITVAMAGSRTTGKSVYVGVLVKQIQAMAARAGGSFLPIDQASANQYKDNYESVLFKARGLIPPSGRLGTDGALHRVPLAFNLSIPGQPKRAIVLRDVAGEDFEQPQTDSVLFNFLGSADSLFYLVDPLSVRPIQQMLYGLVDTINTQGGDPLATLNNVLNLVSAASNGGQGVKLAVILSKFDALQRLADHEARPWSEIMGNAGAAFSRDPFATNGGWDVRDADLLDAEVRGLLELLGATPLVNLANLEFADRRFFAVSALGVAPAPGGLSTKGRGMAPFRILDPLRWVMNGRGWFT
jgi:hypothetical protein